MQSGHCHHHVLILIYAAAYREKNSSRESISSPILLFTPACYPKQEATCKFLGFSRGQSEESDKRSNASAAGKTYVYESTNALLSQLTGSSSSQVVIRTT